MFINQMAFFKDNISWNPFLNVDDEASTFRLSVPFTWSSVSLYLRMSEHFTVLGHQQAQCWWQS